MNLTQLGTGSVSDSALDSHSTDQKCTYLEFNSILQIFPVQTLQLETLVQAQTLQLGTLGSDWPYGRHLTDLYFITWEFGLESDSKVWDSEQDLTFCILGLDLDFIVE